MQDDTPIRPQRGDALLVVDVQNDFLPGGSLSVACSDEVIAPMNAAIEAFRSQGLPVHYTRDWHPINHRSFAAQGGLWPPHCVANTHGADFAPALDVPDDAVVTSKAMSAERDAYSGFEGTELETMLRAQGATRLFVGGLATDYCVLNTVRDARRLGFDVVLLGDAIRAVDRKRGDGERAIAEMKRIGAQWVDSLALAVG